MVEILPTNFIHSHERFDPAIDPSTPYTIIEPTSRVDMYETSTSTQPSPHEQSTGPVVDTLVDSKDPAARAYTIDNISLPDFDTLATNDEEGNYLVKYVIKNTPEGARLTARDVAINDKPYTEMKGFDSIQVWLVNAMGAVGLKIPEEGFNVNLISEYLFGLVPHKLVKSTDWHIESGMGAFSLFSVDTTEVLDESFQDSNTVPDILACGYVSEEVLMAMAGHEIAGHIRTPKAGQTLYLGPRALHRKPTLRPGQSRTGLLCFIDPVFVAEATKPSDLAPAK